MKLKLKRAQKIHIHNFTKDPTLYYYPSDNTVPHFEVNCWGCDWWEDFQYAHGANCQWPLELNPNPTKVAEQGILMAKAKKVVFEL